MPNHITNAIIMKNITKLPVFGEYDDSKDNKPELYFDFNKIIPMPDELQVVSGSIENIAVEMAIRLYDKNGEAYQEYHQYSDEDFENRRKNYTESDLELADIGLKYLSNAVKYNASNWYIWCNRNWGTKWNSYKLNVINKDCITFQTAWAPPVPVLIELSRMNPKTPIFHYWCDEVGGIGSGYFEYLDGEIVKCESTIGEDEHHISKYTEIIWNLSEKCFVYDKKKDLNILVEPIDNVA